MAHHFVTHLPRNYYYRVRQKFKTYVMSIAVSIAFECASSIDKGENARKESQRSDPMQKDHHWQVLRWYKQKKMVCYDGAIE